MAQNPSFRKTRLAPTPSGYLHLGNILSFATTAAIAKRTGAKIFLRIDDIDRERTNKLFVQDIFDTLNFLEISWDEGPKDFNEHEQEYAYIHKTHLYNKALQQLKDSNAVFACTCSRADMLQNDSGRIYPGTCCNRNIPLETANTNWRLYTNNERLVSVKTLQGHTVQAHLPPDMQYFVVKKKDDFPAYQLTSLVDDTFSGIDLIIRGEDLWHSTLAQLYLAQVLQLNQFADTTFYHHPLLTTPEGEKLSKSAGATSIQYLRKQNKKPADIYTMIARTLGVETPVAGWEELVLAANLLPML